MMMIICRNKWTEQVPLSSTFKTSFKPCFISPLPLSSLCPQPWTLLSIFITAVHLLASFHALASQPLFSTPQPAWSFKTIKQIILLPWSKPSNGSPVYEENQISLLRPERPNGSGLRHCRPQHTGAAANAFLSTFISCASWTCQALHHRALNLPCSLHPVISSPLHSRELCSRFLPPWE